MPDIKILLFIGFVIYQIIVFISKNKAKKEVEQASPPSQQPSSSLEDILQRMDPEYVPQQEKGKPAPRKQAVVLYDQVEEEKPRYVQKKFKNTKPLETQEVSTVNYEKTQPTFSAAEQKPFDEYETEKKKTSRYAKLMKNPQTFRDAFVINEIMNPKYI